MLLSLMLLFFRKLLLLSVCFVIIVGLVLVIWLWQLAGTLTNEIRTPVPEYYQTWLNHPEQHGMKLQKIPCENGQSRCLIASPDAQSILGQRGIIMRQQLQSMHTLPPVHGTAKGLLVLLHGRGSRKEFMLPIAERFVAAGFICIIPDLPAHGEHLAKQQFFASKDSEAHFANKILNEARQYLNRPKLPAAIWAMSLGGVFANRSVAHNEQLWQGLVIVSSFDELDKVLRDKLNFLPHFLAEPIQSLFLQIIKWRVGFDVKESNPKFWAKTITLPVLLAHGDQDKVIQPSRGRALFNSYASKDKTWISVRGGNHHNVLITPMPLYATMGAWLLTHIKH